MLFEPCMNDITSITNQFVFLNFKKVFRKPYSNNPTRGSNCSFSLAFNRLCNQLCFFVVVAFNGLCLWYCVGIAYAFIVCVFMTVYPFSMWSCPVNKEMFLKRKEYVPDYVFFPWHRNVLNTLFCLYAISCFARFSITCFAPNNKLINGFFLRNKNLIIRVLYEIKTRFLLIETYFSCLVYISLVSKKSPVFLLSGAYMKSKTAAYNTSSHPHVTVQKV